MVTSEDSLRRGGEALNNYRHLPTWKLPLLPALKGQGKIFI